MFSNSLLCVLPVEALIALYWQSAPPEDALRSVVAGRGPPVREDAVRTAYRSAVVAFLLAAGTLADL